MKKIFIILHLALMTSCAMYQTCELEHSHSNPDEVKRILRDTVITDVDMCEANITDVVTFLSSSAQEHSKGNRGISLMLIPDSTKPYVAEGDPFENKNNPTSVDSRSVNIEAKTITYYDLLEEICRQADLVWRITPKCLVITPKEM